MSQEEHEPLNQRDLNQNVAETHSDEVHQSSSLMVLRSVSQQEWKNEKSEHRQDRDDQQHSKDGHTKVHLPIHGGTVRVQVQQSCWLEREKEKRCVVGDRRDIVVVGSREDFRIVALD